MFTYNRFNQTASGEFGANWDMNYKQKIIVVNSTTAVVHKGNGLSLTYTNKDANGVYTAPDGAENKLVQNADSTWSETQLGRWDMATTDERRSALGRNLLAVRVDFGAVELGGQPLLQVGADEVAVGFRPGNANRSNAMLRAVRGRKRDTSNS
ncbi:MAG: hypothetical protein WD847_19240 [Pirellulales bacterium]